MDNHKSYTIWRFIKIIQNLHSQRKIRLIFYKYSEFIIYEKDIKSERVENTNRCSFIFFQQQQLIELIREKNVEAALEFAQTQLAERGEENPEILSELERTLALLAFESPELSPFGELLHPSQRQKVLRQNLKIFTKCDLPLKY